MSDAVVKWRVHQSRFQGAGPYVFSDGASSLTTEVDDEGYFTAPPDCAIPFYAFAALAGEDSEREAIVNRGWATK